MIDTEKQKDAPEEPAKAKIALDDIVKLNPGFTSKLVRINLPIPTHEESYKR